MSDKIQTNNDNKYGLHYRADYDSFELVFFGIKNIADIFKVIKKDDNGNWVFPKNIDPKMYVPFDTSGSNGHDVEDCINGGKLYSSKDDSDTYMLYGVIGEHCPEYDFLACYNRKFILMHVYDGASFYISDSIDYLGTISVGCGRFEMLVNEDNKIYELNEAVFLGLDKSKFSGQYE